MKRFLPITVLAVFAYPAATISCQSGKKAADPQIFWDGGAIPDPVFRTYVLDNFDTDRDGKISRKEADAVLAIDLGRLCAELGPATESLAGIEYFKNLKQLICNGNTLAELDLSQNTRLTELNCWDNPLPALNLSKNTELVKLNCNYTALAELDLTQNKHEIDGIVLSCQSIDGTRSLQEYGVKGITLLQQPIDRTRSDPK